MRNDKKLLSINEERTHGTQIQTAASHSLEILRVVQDFVTKNQKSQIANQVQAIIDASQNIEYNFVKVLEISAIFLSNHKFLDVNQVETINQHLAIVEKGKSSKEVMISRNQGLVHKLASSHLNQKVPLDDLIQAGNLGLMRAVEKFDPNRGNKFSTYARDWIKQTINRYVDEQHTIKIPEYQRNKITRIRKIQNSILQATGKEPSLSIVAAECDMSEREVEELLTIKQDAVSLNKAVGEGESDLEDLIQDQMSPSPESAAEETMVKNELRKALNELSEAEQEVIVKRFSLDGGDKATLEEIGESQGISKEAVRLKIQRLLRKLALSPGLRSLDELND